MTRLLLWAVSFSLGALLLVAGVWVNDKLTRLFEGDDDEGQ